MKGEKLKNVVEVCANCGKLSKSTENFICVACGCEVCVVLPIKMAERLIKKQQAKQNTEQNTEQ